MNDLEFLRPNDSETRKFSIFIQNVVIIYTYEWIGKEPPGNLKENCSKILLKPEVFPKSEHRFRQEKVFGTQVSVVLSKSVFFEQIPSNQYRIIKIQLDTKPKDLTFQGNTHYLTMAFLIGRK